MRRHQRGPSGGALFAPRANGNVIPDPLSLIRAYDSDMNPTRPVRPSPLTASTIQGLPLDLFDRLRSFPLFLSAPDSFLAAIGSHLRPQLYNSHDYILTEGDDAKAMYWLVRGAVRVTSRDGESTYAELKPGAFFGEIGILMDIPRTATIIAKLKSLVVRLNKEDLMKELPKYPEVERAILEEANERLSILKRKKKENAARSSSHAPASAAAAAAAAAAATATAAITDPATRSSKRTRDRMAGDVEMGDVGVVRDGEVLTTSKKRKSPSPSVAEPVPSSALGSGAVNVRALLRELPLFSSLPAEILHFLGLNAQPRTYPPFTDIIQQGSQGRDVFFIVRGEVEVVQGMPVESNALFGKSVSKKMQMSQQVKARLRPGQYFGEVTSLSLAPRRTATVRTVTSVECLMVGGDVLEELWQMCSSDLRQQVEETARQRLQAARTRDVTVRDGKADISIAAAAAATAPSTYGLAVADARGQRKQSVPTVSFTERSSEASLQLNRLDERPLIEPFDPDPFWNVDLDNMRSRSRRSSLAPPSPSTTPDSSQQTHMGSQVTFSSTLPINSSPLKPKHSPPQQTPPQTTTAPRLRSLRKTTGHPGRGILPTKLLNRIFNYLDILELMRLRQVSSYWMKLLFTSQNILQVLDLTPYNRQLTDAVLVDIICPFVGNRPRYVDISNCFHLSDEGFSVLAMTCAPDAKVWKMKSVWDITGQAVLEMANQAKNLEEVDLSNCRKVGDNLLARIVGWVVPDTLHLQQQQQQQQQQQKQRHTRKQSQQQQRRQHEQQKQQQEQQNNGNTDKKPSLNNANNSSSNNTNSANVVPAGTVVGCPRLKRLTLSYCKHITDRSMAHLAVHAAGRIEEIDLTRCTSISDEGFHHWSAYPFTRLRKLCLADCTYLSDHAIVYLTNAAKGLRELDLVSLLFFSSLCLSEWSRKCNQHTGVIH